MYRFVTSIFLLCALSISASSAQARTLKLKPRAIGAGSDITAGDERYLLWRAGPSAEIRDTRLHRNHHFNVSPGCETRDLSAGRVLIDCTSSATATIQTVDVDGNAAGPAIGYQRNSWLVGELGRYWVSFTPVSRGSQNLYVNWRTGEEKVGSQRLNVDSPTLAPLPKRSVPNPRFVPVRNKRALRVLVGTRRVTLSRCAHRCTHTSLVFGRAAWIEGHTLTIVRLFDMRRWTIELSSDSASLFYPYMLTRYEIVVDRGSVAGSHQYAAAAYR